MLYFFYIYIFQFVTAEGVLYNEECINCYRNNTRMHFNDAISRHLYESTISRNLSVTTSADVFALKSKCKGAIVTSNLVLTSASYFENKTDSDEYAVYVGYQILDDNKHVSRYSADKIYLHPDYVEGNDSHNIAVIKVKTHFLFNVSGSSMGILPDNPLSLPRKIDSVCTMLNYRDDASGMDTLRSLEIRVLTKEECADLIRLNHLTFSLNASSFCVRAYNSSIEQLDVILGATCVCEGIIRGIVTRNFKQIKIHYPIPVVDVGLYSNWVRRKIINLNQVSKTGLPYFNVTLFVLLSLFVLNSFCL